MRHLVEFSGQVTGQKAALHGDQTPHTDAVAEERVRRFLRESSLPSRDLLATSTRPESAGGAAENKIPFFYLAVVDHSQHSGIT